MKPATTRESKSVIQKKTRRADHPDTVKLYPAIDTPQVRQFIEAKARNSVNTAKGYREGIYRLAQFLKSNYPQYDIETILKAKELDYYKLIDQYITFLSKRSLSTATIKVYVAAVRNYLQYNDIEIVPWKFKNKVTMPKDRKEDEYALDKEEIRKILIAISNRRLKAYCAVLACAGMRPVEALALRNKDIDFTVRPTKLYMQAKYAKNKLPREIYITTEATSFLNQWHSFKYDDDRGRSKNPDDLVFAVMKGATPEGMYGLVAAEFRDVLKSADLDDRKDTGKLPRGKITLYSFRRFVKTTLEDKLSYSMSEYILGHKKSVYYTKKEHERREKYAECERFLTYLDYTAIDQQTKSLESQQSAAQDQITAMQKQIDELKQIALHNEDVADKWLTKFAMAEAIDGPLLVKEISIEAAEKLLGDKLTDEERKKLKPQAQIDAEFEEKKKKHNESMFYALRDMYQRKITRGERKTGANP